MTKLNWTSLVFKLRLISTQTWFSMWDNKQLDHLVAAQGSLTFPQALIHIAATTVDQAIKSLCFVSISNQTDLLFWQAWYSMWDNEQLDHLVAPEGSQGGSLVSPQALAQLQPEAMRHEDLEILDREIARQQMNAQGRAPEVQEASLEDLIDRDAYKEVG